MKTVLKNGNVFYQNKIQKLDVEIDGETISQIGHDLDGENIIDCTDLLVTPCLLYTSREKWNMVITWWLV